MLIPQYRNRDLERYFMKKPSNRKEYITFLKKKYGSDIITVLAEKSDHEVKKYFNTVYKSIKNQPDFITKDTPITCLRCGCEVERHYECGCGYDKVIFTKYEWE